MSGDACILAVPLLASGNAGGFLEIIKNAIANYNKCGMKGGINNSVYVNSKDMLLTHVRKDHDILEWKEIWKKLFYVHLIKHISHWQNLRKNCGISI